MKPGKVSRNRATGTTTSSCGCVVTMDGEIGSATDTAGRTLSCSGSVATLGAEVTCSADIAGTTTCSLRSATTAAEAISALGSKTASRSVMSSEYVSPAVS